MRIKKATAFFLLTFSVIVPGFAARQSSEQEVELSFRAGQAALRQGDFARATEEFKKVLTLEPNLLEAEVNLGLAYQASSSTTWRSPIWIRRCAKGQTCWASM